MHPGGSDQRNKGDVIKHALGVTHSMSTLRKTGNGITYDLGADGSGGFYLMHFLIEDTWRVGGHLPAFDVWAIVERDDYAMYLILEPMVNDWPQFIYTCGTRHEGIPIEN